MRVKVKDPKVNSNKMDKITDELYKLGFYGGKMNSGKSKIEFYFDRRSWSELNSDNEMNSAMRYRNVTEFSLNIVYDIKLNSVVWSYGSEKELAASTSQGLNSKLVALLG